MTQTDNITKTRLVTFSSFLLISQRLDILSLSLSLMALFFWLLASWSIGNLYVIILCLITFFIGLISKYYALRIAFDRKLFEYLASQSDRLPEAITELDDALGQLNLIKANQQNVRSIHERENGTMKLFKKQIAYIILQLGLLTALALGVLFF
ncbi:MULTISPECIES: hypothetical protein [unclassified Gilliamella]|uniref:hypothetical protein n=1 Tax=unclassified Gilliamella TaxID=2685620 RepID=UPI002269DEAF|nr:MULTISPECIES: hypothetical protein [unclassified Gilliamella]MCX8602184.1 hypothetical protein [Gilliamella sp. B3722]MCX8607167.1 hypothetical protein [Gilliamella sp. B3771]MCX8611454.1 hypothetical protein [Gilliamella sp. B3891]MCX8613924.1 hypothetical protein [Gilliamella sp. B3773]MCX8614899.1 hypothetical protein [Gilliamella sp. B3770]